MAKTYKNKLIFPLLALIALIIAPKAFSELLERCNTKFCIRYRNSIERSKSENEKWDFKKERIESGWHVIDKDVINADKYLFNYLSTESWGLPGGYIESINQDTLFGTNGRGEVFLYSFSQNKFKLVSSNLHDIYKEQMFEKYVKPPFGKVGQFGIKDIYLDREKKYMYASVTKNISGDGCYGMAIYKANLKNLDFQNVEKSFYMKFKEYFQTSICNRNFNGHRTGGRIKKYKDQIIFTVGDLAISLKKENSGAIIPKNKENIIGQVLSINEKGESTLISSGHRNPQGLEIVGDRIFVTEHGPQGGDEINLIKNIKRDSEMNNPKKNKNYGWPLYVYGFSYQDTLKFKFPHEGDFIDPIHYFTPSIGISEITYYENNHFPFWNKKLILTSLNYSSIYIMDFDQKNEMFKSVEKIPIGHRIRDIETLPNGEIVLITDDQKIIKLKRSKNDTINVESKVLYKYK